MFDASPSTDARVRGDVSAGASANPAEPMAGVAKLPTLDELGLGFEAPIGGGSVDTSRINAGINLAIILAVLAAVGVKILTVDADISRGWTVWEVLSRIGVDNWEGYSSFLTEQPVLTKAITSGAVYTFGDAIAQVTEGQDLSSIDRVRILRSAACGFLAHGPLSHVWYNVAETIFTTLHMEDWHFTPLKVALDQLTWGPSWNAFYILLLRLSTGTALPTIGKEIQDTSLPLLRDGFKLWIPAHTVTYGLIPLENRLLWVDAVEVIWVIILSSTAAASKKAADEASDASAMH